MKGKFQDFNAIVLPLKLNAAVSSEKFAVFSTVDRVQNSNVMVLSAIDRVQDSSVIALSAIDRVQDSSVIALSTGVAFSKSDVFSAEAISKRIELPSSSETSPVHPAPVATPLQPASGSLPMSTGSRFSDTTVCKLHLMILRRGETLAF